MAAIIRLNIDDDPKVIIVKADQQPVNTVYAVQLIGSGSTTVNNISGNTWIVGSSLSGATQWGTIGGTLSGQTDLWNTLTGMTVDIQDAEACCTGLTVDFNSHTGDTVIHFSGHTFTASGITVITQVNDNVNIYVPPDTVTGVSWNGVTSKPAWLSGTTLSDFEGDHNHDQYSLTGHNHTGVYSPTGHTHSQYLTGYTVQCSDVTGCTDGLYSPVNHLHTGVYSPTGHTHAQYLTGYTVTAGDVTGITASLYSPLGHIHAISGVTGLQAALDGKSATGHTHAQYLTGFTVTCDMVTGCTDGLYALQSDFTGHTGNTLIHFEMNEITGFTSTSDFTGLTETVQNHTGDTTIHYAQSAITITKSQISDMGNYALQSDFTGHTSDTTIHYAQSAITINESQVTNLVTDLAGKSGTGHTHTIYVNKTGDTMTGTLNVPTLNYTANLQYNTVNTGLKASLNYGNLGVGNLSGIAGRYNTHIGYSVGSGDGGRFNTGLGYSTLSFSGLSAYHNTGIGAEALWYVSSGNGNNTAVGSLAGTTITTGDFNTILGAASNTSTATDSNSIIIGFNTTGKGSNTVLIGNTSITGTYLRGTVYVNDVALDNLYASKLALVKQETGTTYTLQSSDNGYVVEFTNTGATTITLPTGLTTNMQVTLVSYGNGTTSGIKTLAAGTGASVKSKNSALKLATVFGAATAYYRGSNVWIAFGDLTV